MSVFVNGVLKALYPEIEGVYSHIAGYTIIMLKCGCEVWVEAGTTRDPGSLVRSEMALHESSGCNLYAVASACVKA